MMVKGILLSYLQEKSKDKTVSNNKQSNMEKDLVPNEESLALKELGFGEPCFGYYYTLNGKDWKFAEKSEYYRLDDEINIGSKFSLLAPTFYQAFRWFRDKHNLNPLIAFCEYAIESENAWKYTLDNPTKVLMWDGKFNTYEEAELDCLKKLIEIVKKK